jgi:hypothetical protein
VVNIAQPITNHTIEGVQQKGDHLVYLVQTDNGPFIMKGDRAVGNNPFNNPSQRLNFPIELMNAIDPNGQSRVMTKPELMKMRDFAKANGAKVKITPGGHGFLAMVEDALLPPLPPGFQLTKTTKYQTVAFSLMQVKEQMLDLLSASEHRTKTGDKDQIRRIQAAFKAPGGLEKMGSILAVDAFTGNNDRVQFTPELRATIGAWNGVTMKCIINPGNVFLAFENGRDAILGLDSFDPNTQFGNIKEFRTDSYYPGTLHHSGQLAARTTLFTEFCADVEGLLGPRDRTFSFQKQTRLPINAVTRIGAGWNAAAPKILSFYKQKYARGGTPPAMVERFKACGWWNAVNFPNK